VGLTRSLFDIEGTHNVRRVLSGKRRLNFCLRQFQPLDLDPVRVHLRKFVLRLLHEPTLSTTAKGF